MGKSSTREHEFCRRALLGEQVEQADFDSTIELLALGGFIVSNGPRFPKPDGNESRGVNPSVNEIVNNSLRPIFGQDLVAGIATNRIGVAFYEHRDLWV